MSTNFETSKIPINKILFTQDLTLEPIQLKSEPIQSQSQFDF